MCSAHVKSEILESCNDMENLESTYKQIIILLSFVILLCNFSCSGRWMRDVEVHGLSFEKLRYSCVDDDTVSIIGLLEEDSEIEGFVCRQGWVHFDKDWNLGMFCLDKEASVGNVSLPSGSWVIDADRDDRTTVVFPRDTLIQGFPVQGGGGSKGVQTRFYKTGALWCFFASKDFTINGVEYKRSSLQLIELDINGIPK